MDTIFSDAFVKMRKRYPGCLAPETCVRAIQAAVKYPYTVGIKEEEELFMYLRESGQARALQYAFFAEKNANKWSTPSGASWKTASARPISSVGVLGSCHRFVGNQMLRPYYDQTYFLLEDGSKPEEIDQVLEEFGLEHSLYALINEAFRILGEGMAASPEHIDVIYLYGYGWPRHRGGPMFYASTVGLPKVLEKLEKYYRQNPDIPQLEPSAYLRKLASQGNPPLREWQRLAGPPSSKL